MALKLKRILVPFDFSPNSESAKDMADAVAAQFKAKVELLHVVESSPYESYVYKGFLGDVPIHEPAGEGVPNYYSQVVIKNLVKETQDRLTKIAKKHKPAYLAKVRSGHVVEEVLEEISAFKPDLVVMSTHGWTGFKHLLLGSVAEKIVRFSPVPVLTTKGEAVN